jgi:selenide,water dikinase
VLGGLPHASDPNVLVGNETADDAGVYRVSDDLALVQTVDYFTPVVDDPYDFGAVAAANALSDIYAMGAEPFMALNIVGFPVGDLPLGVLQDILRGGADICVQAGVSVVGGHSIDDPEPKFGLAVTGRVHPDRILRNNTARPGDVLVLTKPLGVGILTTAIKRGLLEDAEIRQVVALMTVLNRGASEAALEVGVSAATDITGYGLLGHLLEMARGSGLRAVVARDAVPLLSERVLTLAAEGAVPGGSRKNLKYVSEVSVFDPGLSPEEQIVLADAQTSGGLLLAVDPGRAQDLIRALKARGTPAAAAVGRLEDGPPGTLTVVRTLAS